MLFHSKRNFIWLFFQIMTCWACFLPLQAQNPCFDVSTVKGCAPLTVTVGDCSGVSPNLVFYRFGNARPQNSPTFTFEKAGVYAITQLINTGASGGDSLRIENLVTVYESKPFTPEVYICSGRRVEVRISDTYYDFFKIIWDNEGETIVESNQIASHVFDSDEPKNLRIKGVFEDALENCFEYQEVIVPISTRLAANFSLLETQEDGSLVFTFELPENQPYQIRKKRGNQATQDLERVRFPRQNFTYQPNDSSSVYFLAAAGTEFCNEEALQTPALYGLFLEVEALAGFNRLAWNPALLPATDFVGYQIYRNDQLLTEIRNLRTTTFEDFEVVCRQNYCYRVAAIWYDSAAQTVSNRRCVVASSDAKPPEVDSFFVSIDSSNRVFLRWQYPQNQQVEQMYLLSQTPDDIYTREQRFKIDSARLDFFDPFAAPSLLQYCYRAFYLNACGQYSDTTAALCPIFLQVERREQDAILQRTDYQNGFAPARRYTLQLFDLDTVLIETRSFSENETEIDLSQTEQQAWRFRTWAIVGQDTTFSNFAILYLPSFLEIPTAFSPNGDSINDDFGVVSRFLVSYHLQIFNKWNQLIFETNDLENRWDGTFEGRPAPADDYTVLIKATDQVGKSYQKATLLRLLR
ncbi:T9SS type B sorting domain-containing protein [Hugenholtzia roseola]|uniref:T9SS type B sorting domain-containing protein n=1 Tax=Hugenholtzia roseola TaxID=1002 RepID=UPI0012B662AC|nr:T9SS type B sorting domain-containing protein [Hugenholtzia roseola]